MYVIVPLHCWFVKVDAILVLKMFLCSLINLMQLISAETYLKSYQASSRGYLTNIGGRWYFW